MLMVKRFCLALLLPVACCLHVARAGEPEAARYREKAEPVLLEFCFGCHAEGMKKGNVAFDGYESTDALLKDRDLWLRVLKNVRAGIMPPADQPRPSADQQRALGEWIKRDAFGLDAKNPDPGRVTIRRLNRNEYQNTIRDLMGYDFRVDEEFPTDDSGYGFDNIGDVLSISPLLVEKYMQAAETIVAAAVPTAPRVMPEKLLEADSFKRPDGSKVPDKFTFYEPMSAGRPVNVDHAGDYRLGVDVEVDGAFDFDPGKCRMIFKTDDQERLREEFGWYDTKVFHFEVAQAWEAGEHRVQFEFEPLTDAEQKKKPLDMKILSVRVQGPLDQKHWIRTKGYDRFFPRGEAPADEAGRREYAREVLASFLAKAYRRPADRPTVERLAQFAEGIYRLPGKRFEDGLSRAFAAVLASPRFIFRVEEPAPGSDPKAPFGPIDEYSLASRLSYFLWSTMPDAELMKLAAEGQLRSQLEPQVRRMLADARSQKLVENFVGQWLQVRDVDGFTISVRSVLRREQKQDPNRPFVRDRNRVDPQPAFDQLKRFMRQETEMCFAHILREDRSVLELLDARYTFLNEGLAKHYGITGVEGRQMRKVDLPEDSPRGGVLTHASTLVITSNPTRTSPVKRGLFVLENLLGTPAPPPPADVPDFDLAEKTLAEREPTMREIMELHRQQPLCNACHSRMDPLGLALENFNAMGVWRDAERGHDIDTEGKLLSGETFSDIRVLKKILVENHRLDYYRCLTEKLLTYAIGRGPEYYDLETIDQIVERLDRDGGKFSTLLLGVIESAPFQKQRVIGQ